MTLPGLIAGVPIVDTNGAPTQAFLMYMQNVTSGLASSSGATMPSLSQVIIRKDYTGAFLPNEMPKQVQVKRYLNGVDVSAKSRWFITPSSTSITATIDQSGVVTITAMTAPAATLAVKSVRDGVTLACTVDVSVAAGLPPSSGTSGNSSTASATTFTSTSSTADAPITSELSVTVGASGVVTLTAPLSTFTSRAAPTGVFPVFGKWEWYNGTAWQDVAAEVQSSPDCDVTSEIEDTVPPKTIYFADPGSLTVNTSKTGLTVGSTQKFRMSARNSSGTRAVSFSGTATATSS